MKEFGEIDSKFRYVILAAMRAKQLLSGAKPRIKSRSKNLIRIAQEEVKQGLIDYEIVKGIKTEKEEVLDAEDNIFMEEEIAPEPEEKPEKESPKAGKEKKNKSS